VDYTLASTSLFPLISRYEIGDADDYTHLPQTITILAAEVPGQSNITDDPVTARKGQENINQKTRFKWTDKSLEVMMRSDQLSVFDENINCNAIDNAVKSLNALIQEGCSVNSVKNKNVQKSTSNEWWDDEMDTLKYQKYKCLRLLRLDSSKSTLIKYKNIRKIYKTKIRVKREL
jgi:hypothetical protein